MEIFQAFISFLGKNGVLVVIGLAIFLFVLKYSSNIFIWIEKQTYGTRNYILEKFEILFIEMKEDKLTTILSFFALFLATLVLLLFGYLSYWKVGFFFAAITMVAAWRIPKPFVDYLVERRILAYQNQMVDGLTLLANGLRAGLSLPQSLGLVVSELPPPISQEFNLILQQNRIGVSLDESFNNLVVRIPTEDNQMLVSSINILRETGGNLAETFDTIIDIIRERIRLKQKIDTYTAQGMVQAITIGVMPFVVGFVYYVSDPESMGKAFTHPLGIVLILLAITLDVIGFCIIRKIVKIKV